MNGQHSLPVVAKGGEIKEKEDIRVRGEEARSTRGRGSRRRTEHKGNRWMSGLLTARIRGEMEGGGDGGVVFCVKGHEMLQQMKTQGFTL